MRYLVLVLCVLLSGCLPEAPASETSSTLPPEPDVDDYFDIWREYVLFSQGVSGEYFDKYVRVDSVSKRESEYGTLLWIEYRLIVDWASVEAVDSVLIKEVNSSDYLTRAQIYSTPVYLGGFTGQRYLSNSLGNPKGLREVTRIISRGDVTPKLAECYHTLSFDDGEVVLTREGNYVFRARTIISEKDNHCRKASLDLESGNLTDCGNTDCWVR